MKVFTARYGLGL